MTQNKDATTLCDLTKELIQSVKQQIKPLKTLAVDVPEWNGRLYVRAMGGDDKDRFEQLNYVESAMEKSTFKWVGYRARLVRFTACDADGKLLFGDADIAWLGQQPCTALDRIMAEAKKLNAISDADIKELAKN